MSRPDPAHPPTRQCGDCAMCCHLGEIVDFKPYNQWCQFCSTHQGCDIYQTRPQLCRDFFCHYLLSDIGEEWRPLTCHMVVSTYTEPTRLNISVDPAFPDIWRQEPYLAQIIHWSNFGAVTVMVGEYAFAAYPDRIDALGEMTADHTLLIIEQETRAGLRYQVKRVLRSEADAQTSAINTPN